MAVTSNSTDTTTLGCGRDVDDVWSHIDNPPDAHETTCPDCQAARADLASLNAATQQMVKADLDDPTLRIDPAVLDNIVAIARSEVRRGSKIPLRQGSEGQFEGELMISEHSIATVVRRVSDTVPEVEARRCRIRLTPRTHRFPGGQETEGAGAEPGPALGTTRPSQVSIDLSVTVLPHLAIGELVDSLRNLIILTVTAEIGVEVTRVDITVEDIHDPAEGDPGDDQPDVNGQGSADV